MKSPVSASRWPRRTPFLFPNEWRVSWQNLDKDSPPSDPYPTGRHTRPPREGQEMEARPWGSYSSICCHGHASVSVPIISVFNQTVSTVRHLSWTSGRTGFLLTKANTHTKTSISEFQKWRGGAGVDLCSFRRLCGKCASAHTCVMWCFRQVLEASFHCVTFWHHPGLPAPPSAAMRRSVTDNQADPGLLQVCLSLVAMKTNGNEDAVLHHASCPHIMHPWKPCLDEAAVSMF